MRAIDLKTLKGKLSRYVRLAANGETVLVTDRGRVVAEIVPPRVERGTFVDGAMPTDVVHQNSATPPTLAAAGVPPPR